MSMPQHNPDQPEEYLNQLIRQVGRSTAEEVIQLQSHRRVNPTSLRSLMPLPYDGSIYGKPFKYWWDDFLEYGKAADLEEDRLLAHLPCLMIEQAQTKYRQLKASANPPDTAAEWFEQLEACFPFERTRDFHLEYLRQLQYQNHKMSVSQLASAVRNSAGIAIESEVERDNQSRHVFVFALPPEIRNRIRSAGDELPKTFETAVIMAEKVEMNLQRERGETSAAFATAISGMQQLTVGQLHGQPNIAASAPQRSFNSNASSNSRGRQPTRSWGRGQANRNSSFGSRLRNNSNQQQRQQHRSNNFQQSGANFRSPADGKCFNCGLFGHFASQCDLLGTSAGGPIQRNDQRPQQVFQNSNRSRGRGNFRGNNRNRGRMGVHAIVEGSDEIHSFDDTEIADGSFNAQLAFMGTILAAPIFAEPAPTVLAETSSANGGQQAASNPKLSWLLAAANLLLLSVAAFRIAITVLCVVTLLPTLAVSTGQDYYTCERVHSGQYFYIPAPPLCTVDPLGFQGTWYVTQATLFTRKQTVIPAWSCSIHLRRSCTYVDATFLQALVLDETFEKSLSPSQCRRALESKIWRGAKLHRDNNGGLSTSVPHNHPHQYCCKEVCALSENLHIRTGTIQTLEHLVSSALGDVGGCAFESLQCVSETATIIWDKPKEPPADCKLEATSELATVQLVSNYLIVTDPPVATTILAKTSTCDGDIAYNTSNGLIVAFFDDDISAEIDSSLQTTFQRRRQRALIPQDEPNASPERKRALVRSMIYQLQQLQRVDTTAFSSDQLEQHEADIATANAYLKKYQEFLPQWAITTASTTTTTTTASTTTTTAAATPSANIAVPTTKKPKPAAPRPAPAASQPQKAGATPAPVPKPTTPKPAPVSNAATVQAVTPEAFPSLIAAQASPRFPISELPEPPRPYAAPVPADTPTTTVVQSDYSNSFAALWTASCQLEQQRLRFAQQLQSIDATATARYLLQRQDVVATNAGHTLLVWQCSTCDNVFVHKSQQHEGKCYEYVPADTNTGVMYVVPGSYELVSRSQEIPCVGLPANVYYDNNRWLTAKGATFATSVAAGSNNANSLFSTPVTNDTAEAATTFAIRRSFHRDEAPAAAFDLISRYVAELASNPEQAVRTLSSAARFASAMPSNASTAMQPGFHFLLTGKAQLASQAVLMSLVLLLLFVITLQLLKKLWQLTKAIRQRHRRHHDDGPGEASMPLVSFTNNPAVTETTTVTIPRSLGDAVLRGLQCFTANEPQRPRPNRLQEKANAVMAPTLAIAVIGSVARSPVVDIALCNFTVQAMLDTGAAVNLLRQDVYQNLLKLHPQAFTSLQPPEVQVLTIDGKAISTIGRTFSEVVLNSTSKMAYNKQMAVPFVVVSDLAIPCILGTEYLTRFKDTHFQWRNKIVMLGNNRLPLSGTVHTPKRLRGFAEVLATMQIPARTTAIFNVQVHHPYDKKSVLLFEPSSDFEENTELVGAASLNTPSPTGDKTATIPVKFLNANMHPVTLYKGTIIGKTSPYETQLQNVHCYGSIDPSQLQPPASSASERDKFLQKATKLTADKCKHLSSEEQSTVVRLLCKYADVFAKSDTDIGLTNVYQHRIPTTDTVPVCVRPYKVSVADQKEIARHIETFLQNDVIEEAEETRFNAPIFLIPKKSGNGTRFIVDYRQLNLKVVAPVFQALPDINNILAVLGKSKFFTAMDSCWGFYQVPIHEADRHKTSFCAPDGSRWQFKRLPMGLMSAPYSFSKAMSIILSGLQWTNTLAYMDDVLIHSPDFKTHVRDVEEVFSRLKKSGLKLRLEKCFLFQNELQYLGFQVSSEGLMPSPEKVKVVREFVLDGSSTVTDVRSYLGVCSFFRRFIPNFSRIALPLTNLTKDNQPFSWTPECQRAFESLKQALISPPVLAFPDFTKEFILYADSSDTTIGGVLLQYDDDNNLKPLAYGSAKLTPTVARYPIIEKEAFAVNYFLKSFQYIIHKLPTTIYTDHAPLVQILRKKPAGVLDSPRLTKWSLKLQAENITLKYLPGKDNLADFFSRIKSANSIPEKLPETVSNNAVAKSNNAYVSATAVIYALHASPLPTTAADIRNATRNCPVLSQVLAYEQFGWPEDSNLPAALLPFFKRRSEIRVDNEILLWGARVIIPAKLRNEVLQELHLAHPGMTKMKLLARKFCWFPGINSEIESLVQNCEQCNKNRPEQPPSQFQPWPVPSAVWQRLHIDHAGPFLNSLWLIVVCARSKWPEVLQVNSTASVTTINALRSVFARFGLPQEIVSDNATSFSSEEFRTFCRTNGIKQSFAPPMHPRSNGFAEIFVKIFKQAMLSMQEPNLQERLQKFLLAYRATPHTATKLSPAEIMFGRPLRTRLDLLKPSLDQTLQNNQRQQKRFHDARAKQQEFEIGDSVWARNYVSNQAKWLQGKVLEKLGIIYLVEVNGMEWRRHAEQLRHFRKRTTADKESSDAELDSQAPDGGNAIPLPHHPSVVQPTQREDDAVPSTSTTAATAGSRKPAVTITKKYPLRSRLP